MRTRIKDIHKVRGKWTESVPRCESMELELEKRRHNPKRSDVCSLKRHQQHIGSCEHWCGSGARSEGARRSCIYLCEVGGGVQSQTSTVGRQMKRYDILRVVSINELDCTEADPWKCNKQICEKLCVNVATVQLPIGLEHGHSGAVNLVRLCSYKFLEPDKGKQDEREIPADGDGTVQATETPRDPC